MWSGHGDWKWNISWFIQNWKRTSAGTAALLYRGANTSTNSALEIPVTFFHLCRTVLYARSVMWSETKKGRTPWKEAWYESWLSWSYLIMFWCCPYIELLVLPTSWIKQGFSSWQLISSEEIGSGFWGTFLLVFKPIMNFIYCSHGLARKQCVRNLSVISLTSFWSTHLLCD